MKSLLEQKYGVPKEEIKILNAQVLDDNPNDMSVRTITIGKKLPVKILITTSVLDNGVSIQDSEVGNVIIATESRVSFLQMLGRVRSEVSKKLNFSFIQEIALTMKNVCCSTKIR